MLDLVVFGLGVAVLTRVTDPKCSSAISYCPLPNPYMMLTARMMDYTEVLKTTLNNILEYTYRTFNVNRSALINKPGHLHKFPKLHKMEKKGAQWLSGRVLDSRPKGRGFEPHRCHCVVSLSKNINPSLVLVQPRKTRPFITERLLMGRKESNKTKTKENGKKCMMVQTKLKTLGFCTI